MPAIRLLAPAALALLLGAAGCDGTDKEHRRLQDQQANLQTQQAFLVLQQAMLQKSAADLAVNPPPDAAARLAVLYQQRITVDRQLLSVDDQLRTVQNQLWDHDHPTTYP